MPTKKRPPARAGDGESEKRLTSQCDTSNNTVDAGPSQAKYQRNADREENVRCSTVSALKAAIRRRGGLKEVEIANLISEHYVTREGEGVCDEGKLYIYDEDVGIYRAVTKSEVTTLVYALDGTLISGSNAFRTTARLASSVFTIVNDKHTRPGFFGDSPVGIALANGFLTIKNGLACLDLFDAQQRQRDRVEIAYRPDATCPRIEEFLINTVHDPEAVELVFEITGVALLGLGSRYQRAFVFLGDGANGKSVITTLMQKVMPPGSVSSLPPQELTNDYQRVPLAHSRLNLVGEFTEFSTKSWAQLKSAISGDPMSFRAPGSVGFTVSPRALHVSSTNQLPPLPEQGYAVERRFRAIRCLNTVME